MDAVTRAQTLRGIRGIALGEGRSSALRGAFRGRTGKNPRAGVVRQVPCCGVPLSSLWLTGARVARRPPHHLPAVTISSSFPGETEIESFYRPDRIFLGRAQPMDLDQLRTFLEIVRLKSFSKAAQTCHRSQPAISAQIRQLELELDTALFHRFGSRISLTPAGAVFAEYAARILELRQQAQEALQELEQSPRGALTIAANEATCVHVLPDVFVEYRRRFPQVQLRVERLYGRRVLEAVLENQADFGIAQVLRSDRKLQVVKIHTDEIKLIAPPGHALAQLEAVSAQQAVEFPLILPKYGTTRERLDEWLESVEDRLQVSMELDSSEMIKRFVARGLGVSFMAASHCRVEQERGELALVRLAPEPLLRRLCLIYRRDRPLSRAALGFIEVVLEQARPEG